MSNTQIETGAEVWKIRYFKVLTGIWCPCVLPALDVLRYTELKGLFLTIWSNLHVFTTFVLAKCEQIVTWEKMRPSSSLLVAYTSMFLGELEKKGKVIGIYGHIQTIQLRGYGNSFQIMVLHNKHKTITTTVLTSRKLANIMSSLLVCAWHFHIFMCFSAIPRNDGIWHLKFS